jgi:glucose-6-phosphate-specific signal transduction histidine kinase
VAEKDRLINEKGLENEKQERIKLLYLFIGSLVLLSSIGLYFILNSRHKKEKFQQVYNTEKRISKKVHDEVANDVYHAMTKLQNKANNKEDILDDLENIYNRTRDISKGISSIDVTAHFNEVIQDLLISYKSNTVSVITKDLSAVEWKNINEIKRATLYRVLQELMTNMLKHSQASVVLISFIQNSNTIVVEYKDNGIGCELVKRNGLLNTENRMASIKGTITFDSKSNKGFSVKITI